MPKLTATRGGIDIDDGTYSATALEIVETPATPNSPDDKPFLKWVFAVDDGSPKGVEMTATSSQRFGPQSKARGWAEALLGRKIPNGEVFDPDTILPRDCLVVIARNEKDFATIVSVLPLPKERPPKAAPALPPPTSAGPEEESGITV